jgi:hypothetical protein
MDECIKLLDNGWTIQLHKNELGSYTATALPPSVLKALDEESEFDDDDDCPEPSDQWITDDHTPSKALKRLTEKVIFGRII